MNHAEQQRSDAVSELMSRWRAQAEWEALSPDEIVALRSIPITPAMRPMLIQRLSGRRHRPTRPTAG